MSTSKSGQPGNLPSNPYARFIPREELGSFAAWNPQPFESPPESPEAQFSGLRKPTLAERAAAEMRPNMKSGHAPVDVKGAAAAASALLAAAGVESAPKRQFESPAAAMAALKSGVPRTPTWRPIIGGIPGQAEAEALAHARAIEAARLAAEAAAKAAEQPAPSIDVDALVDQARQEGYQDGYRNGLAALETYKQQQDEQLAKYIDEHVGGLVKSMQQKMDALEQHLAGRVSRLALELARQVVRTELRDRSALVIHVAEEALGALLTSARHVTMRLNPEDMAVVASQLNELLSTRGVRLVADPTLARGGCIVDSDLATVDASVSARWERAAASIGHMAPWQGGDESHAETARDAQSSEGDTFTHTQP